MVKIKTLPRHPSAMIHTQKWNRLVVIGNPALDARLQGPSPTVDLKSAGVWVDSDFKRAGPANHRLWLVAKKLPLRAAA